MKSDDIEDLFREAAEKYHIDTQDAAAWDDVYDAVHGSGKLAQPANTEGGNKKHWLNLLWLLLIPLGWFAHNVWNDWREGKMPQQKQAYTNNAAKGTAAAAKPADNNIAAVGDNNSAKAQPGDNTTPANSQVIPENNTTHARQNAASGYYSNPAATGKIGNNADAVIKDAQRSNITAPGTGNASAAPGNNSQPIKPGDAVNNAQPSTGDKAKIDVAEAPKNPVTNEVTIVNPNTPDQSTANTAQPGVEQKNGDSKGEKKASNKNNNNRGFYFGLLASPDVSFIHFQKTSTVGVGAGMILGYQFNKHLSVETGLLFDSKNYYTNGQYFNTSKIPYFNGNPAIKIKHVTGDCRMLEIPINVRYTFAAGSKNKWYGIAGVSSYLMGHEYYDYGYTAWGSYYNGGFSYNNHVKNWFSIANIGLGYERSLNTKTNLRVEPFIKMPLGGVGTGSIPITSTGLYIGLTRRIP